MSLIKNHTLPLQDMELFSKTPSKCKKVDASFDNAAAATFCKKEYQSPSKFSSKLIKKSYLKSEANDMIGSPPMKIAYGSKNTLCKNKHESSGTKHDLIYGELFPTIQNEKSNSRYIKLSNTREVKPELERNIEDVVYGKIELSEAMPLKKYNKAKVSENLKYTFTSNKSSSYVSSADVSLHNIRMPKANSSSTINNRFTQTLLNQSQNSVLTPDRKGRNKSTAPSPKKSLDNNDIESCVRYTYSQLDFPVQKQSSNLKLQDSSNRAAEFISKFQKSRSQTYSTTATESPVRTFQHYVSPSRYFVQKKVQREMSPTVPQKSKSHLFDKSLKTCKTSNTSFDQSTINKHNKFILKDAKPVDVRQLSSQKLSNESCTNPKYLDLKSTSCDHTVLSKMLINRKKDTLIELDEDNVSLTPITYHSSTRTNFSHLVTHNKSLNPKLDSELSSNKTSLDFKFNTIVNNSDNLETSDSLDNPKSSLVENSKCEYQNEHNKSIIPSNQPCNCDTDTSTAKESSHPTDKDLALLKKALCKIAIENSTYKKQLDELEAFKILLETRLEEKNNLVSKQKNVLENLNNELKTLIANISKENNADWIRNKLQLLLNYFEPFNLTSSFEQKNGHGFNTLKKRPHIPLLQLYKHEIGHGNWLSGERTQGDVYE